MKSGKRRQLFAAICIAVAAFANTAPAQGWQPDRQITLIVPWAAGGGAEPIARLIADALTEAYGQPVALDFRPGANGTIGTHRVAQSDPDGYTLLVTSQDPIVHKRFGSPPLPYDPDVDITAIAVIAEAPFVIAASSLFSPNTLQEVVDYAKANPGQLNVGLSGFGGGAHHAVAVIASETGIDYTLVPYSGVGERLADLMAGRLDISLGIGGSGYMSGIETGSIKPIAVMGEERLQELPDLMTTVEQGFPGVLASGWYLIGGPGGLSEEIVTSVNAVVVEYLERPDVQERMLGFGNIAATSTAEGVRQKIQEQVAVLERLIDEGLFEVPTDP